MRRASATWYPSRTESRAALRMEASDEEDISPSLSKSSISESIRWRTLEDLMRSPFLLLGPLLRGSRNHPYSPHSLRGMSAVHVVRASCPCQEMLKTEGILAASCWVLSTRRVALYGCVIVCITAAGESTMLSRR